MNTSHPQFEFYDEVEIIDMTCTSADQKQIGAVIGMSQGEAGYYYAVLLDRNAKCQCFFEHELRPTGYKRRREELFPRAAGGEARPRSPE